MEHLKKRIARGDTEAFVEIYDLLGDRLLKYLSARLNPTDAQDVLQEVFTRMVRYHKRFAKSKNLTAYVFLTARNEANRWTEKRRTGINSQTTQVDPALYSEILCHTKPADQLLEQKELAAILTSQLPAVDCEIVQLKIYSELTFAEIAVAMDLPAGTVATKYRRSILKMQAWLDNQHETETNLTRQERS